MKSSAVRTLFAVLVVMGFAVPTFAQDARYIVKFREGRSAAGHAALRAGGAQVVLARSAGCRRRPHSSCGAQWSVTQSQYRIHRA